jgi:hypothetical protein
MTASVRKSLSPPRTNTVNGRVVRSRGLGDGEADGVGDGWTVGAGDVAAVLAWAEAVAEIGAEGATLESQAARPNEDMPRSSPTSSIDARAGHGMT